MNIFMLSTIADYRVLVKDYSASLKQIAKDPQIARDVAYYKDHIGQVQSADELLKDYRLYSYAMKAHGLEDMIYAKAFIKKVLDSDLSDSNSFANKLTDPRYQKFAAAFSFSPATKVPQTSGQVDDTIGLYSNAQAKEDSQVVEDTAYYSIKMDQVKSVDGFLSDNRLKTYALKAVKLDPNTSYEHLKQLLTSDLSDQSSYANQLPDQILTGHDAAGKPVYSPYPKQSFLNFASLFQFNSDGIVPDGASAQTATDKKKIIESYNLNVPGHVTPSAMQLNIDYLKSKMADVQKVSDITQDSRLFGIVKTALGLPANFLDATFENIVNSDLNDPANYARKMGGDVYTAIAKLFNIGTDSKVIAGKTAQSEEQLQSLVIGYQANHGKNDDAQHAKDDAYYKAYIGTIANVDALLKNDRLYTYVLKAYGFGVEELSKDTVKTILTTDRSKRGNFVDQSADSRFKTLADDFNFDAKGKITQPKLAQDPGETQQMAADYIRQKTRFLSGSELKTAQTKAKDEAAYFTSTIEKMKSTSDLLADKRMVAIMLTAKGIDPATTKVDYLKKIFASNLDDASSFANTEKDTRFQNLAASFNFDPKGNITTSVGVGGQSRADFLATNSSYLQQNLEQNAGEDNDGVRLALYFRRMAPGLNSAYDILADAALTEVFRTTFGFPTSMASMDITRQAAIVNSKIKLKDLQDSANLDRFLSRFAAMYDASGTNNTASSALTLLTARR